MKSGTLTKIILANLAAVVALLFIYPQFMISPGELKEGHREITTDCFACHTLFKGVTSEQCIDCHKVDEIGLITTKGEPIKKSKTKFSFHQKLLEEDCVACHSDHQGVETYRTMRRFSHGLLEPAVRQECDTCHQNPMDSLHRQITGNCEQCHVAERWVPATFDHDEYFRFDRHHDTECVTCHKGNDYSRYTCYGCHEHNQWSIRGEHLEEGIRDFEKCVECHRSGDEDEAEWHWRSMETPGSRSFDREGRREHGDDDDD